MMFDSQNPGRPIEPPRVVAEGFGMTFFERTVLEIMDEMRANVACYHSDHDGKGQWPIVADYMCDFQEKTLKRLDEALAKSNDEAPLMVVRGDLTKSWIEPLPMSHEEFAKALDVPRDYSMCRFCNRSMDRNDPCCSRQAENPEPPPQMGVNADDTHKWKADHDLECCRLCGVVRRTDRQNSFCRGLVKMRNPEAMMKGKDDV